MSMKITRDDAMYFLIFSVAAADYKEGFLMDQETISEDEWVYLEHIVEQENLSISNSVEIKKSLDSNDELNFYGMKTQTFTSHHEGANKGAISACIDVIKDESKAIQYKTIYHMFSIACVEDEALTFEDEGDMVSDREMGVIIDVATRGLGVSEEILGSIKNIVAEGDISDLAELTTTSGVELFDELVSLDGIGKKTAIKIQENFPDSVALVNATLDELQKTNLVSVRTALVIKEKYK